MKMMCVSSSIITHLHWRHELRQGKVGRADLRQVRPLQSWSSAASVCLVGHQAQTSVLGNRECGAIVLCKILRGTGLPIVDDGFYVVLLCVSAQCALTAFALQLLKQVSVLCLVFPLLHFLKMKLNTRPYSAENRPRSCYCLSSVRLLCSGDINAILKGKIPSFQGLWVKLLNVFWHGLFKEHDPAFVLERTLIEHTKMDMWEWWSHAAEM